MKKLFALILTLAMILGMTGAFAEAAGNEVWNETEYLAHADIRYDLDRDYSGKTVILHSNDVHGQIDGYACIAGLRTCFENLGADVILADAGDFSQGNPYVNTSKGLSAIEMMNAAKYDVATIGNHEFDFGYPQLKENISKALFPVICSNVTLDETGESILPPSAVITTKSGLKIGFVGMDTPETVSKVNPGLIRMLSFAPAEQMPEIARKAVDGIRADCDLVFGLFHLGVDVEQLGDGSSSRELLKKVTGIDMVLDGHSHTAMTAGQGGEPIQSTGTRFANIGVVVIDNESKGIESNFLLPTLITHNLYTARFIDGKVRADAQEIIDRVNEEYGKVFATSETWLNGERAPGNRTEETNMGDLITDAMIWSVVKEGGIEQVEPNAVVGIVNGGSIRASIEKGDVTKKDINTVLPFGNTVALVYATGAELLEALEASTFLMPESAGGFPQTSGIEWTIDTTKAYDQGAVYMLNGKESNYFAPASIRRVTIRSINGEPFDVNALYAVVTNDFCAVGGDTYNVLGSSTSRFDTGIPLDEAVMGYITEALGGKITEEAYGAPRGSLTVIR